MTRKIKFEKRKNNLSTIDILVYTDRRKKRSTRRRFYVGNIARKNDFIFIVS